MLRDRKTKRESPVWPRFLSKGLGLTFLSLLWGLPGLNWRAQFCLTSGIFLIESVVGSPESLNGFELQRRGLREGFNQGSFRV